MCLNHIYTKLLAISTFFNIQFEMVDIQLTDQFMFWQ